MRHEPRLPDDRVNVSDRHPIRELVQLTAGLTVVCVAIFGFIAFFVDLVVPFIPVEAEVALLKPLVALHKTSGTEAASAERVQEVLDKVAEGWLDKPFKFTVMVIPEKWINAFALPGGLIQVTRGLVDKVGSENELAFVLGHELGHFRNRDHIRGLGRGLVFQLAMTSTGLASVDAMQILGALTSSSFSRDQESNADEFGLDLLQKAYGHVNGSTDFFKRISHGRLMDTVQGFSSTHPGSLDRIEAIKALADERGWPSEGELKAWPSSD